MSDKGIACPACGAIEQYAGKSKKNQDNNSIYRVKECKACGQRFATVEAPIGVVDNKRST